MKDFSPQTNLDNLVDMLDEYGVAVLSDLFTDDECETFKKKVFDHISSKFGVNKPDEFAKLRPVGGGILHNYGISLIEPCLTLKTDQRVLNAFDRIWPEAFGDLTTSLDGIHIGPPLELTTDRRFFTTDTLFHTDQASHKNNKCCVQVINKINLI